MSAHVRGGCGVGPAAGLFHDPRRLMVGDAPFVGVLDVPGTVDRPPVRLYFPAEVASSSSSSSSSPSLASSSSFASSSRWMPSRRRWRPRRAGYFVGGRAAYFLQGYAHVALARHDTRTHRWILRPLLWLASFLLPARYMGVPGTVLVDGADDAREARYAPPSSLRARVGGGGADGDGYGDEGVGVGVGVGGGVGGGGGGDDDPAAKRQRLVLFSHGLTGTGEENTIFCASLAKRGYVVASIHHRDGSSCRAPSFRQGGDCTYYAHFPAGEGFDPRNRLRQVRVRAGEMLRCLSWLLGGDGEGGIDDDDDDDDDAGDHRRIVLDQIRPHLDGGGGAIAAGFSYGAATAALAATMEPDKFRCAVLLDPWLHIDYASRGVEFDFPPEAFGVGWPAAAAAPSASSHSRAAAAEVVSTGFSEDYDDDDDDGDASRNEGGGLRIPSVFINSSQFRGYEKLYGATRRLALRINRSDDNDDDESDARHASSTRDRNDRAEMHVIPGTTHSNFHDGVFWLPKRLVKKAFRLGEADAYDAHEAILDRTIRFLRRF
jgi:platelet-activating factor acetylhydrolase